MDNQLKEIMWRQFGASIDMLENAIALCPPQQWDTSNRFWYIAYHCIFYLDYYLTPDPTHFAPPPPYTLSEFDPDGAMPERTYTKEELVSYLHFCRSKCHDLIGRLDELTTTHWINPYKNYPITEILIYNMRHVQHHAAQLNLLLRQTIDDAPKWVSRTKY